jgi:hypothetical protein
MSREASHEEASESLEAAALDALPAEMQAAIVAHAEHCPTCGPELRALRETTARLAFAASAPSANGVDAHLSRVRARLLARARADLTMAADASVAGAPPPPPPPLAPPASPLAAGRPTRRPRPISLAPALGWALAASLVFAALLWRSESALKRQASALSAQAARDAVVLDTTTRALAASQRELATLSGPQVAVMSLTASGKPAASALMFWDRASNTWTMYAHDLPKLAAGRTYQVWLVTPSAKISAGTFEPDSTGAAHMQAKYALAPDSLRAVAVTLEPAGGVSQPTGPIVIAGSPILTEGK